MAYPLQRTESAQATAQAHVYDLISGDLASYIEEMSDKLAEGLMEDGRAPFAAKLNRQEQEDYYYDKYGEMVYTPDGLPNEQGRDALLEQFGPDAFAEIVRVVLRRRRREMVLAGTPPYSYPEYADQPEEFPDDSAAVGLPPEQQPPPVPLEPQPMPVGGAPGGPL